MFGFILPLLAAALGATASGLLRNRLRPSVAARSLAVTCVALAASATWALMAVAVGAFTEPTEDGHWSAWCWRLYSPDIHMPLWSGAVAGALLAVALLRVVRALAAEHRIRRRLPDCEEGLLVVASAEPVAYAVPGRRGGVVVSTGMIDALDSEERTVMWAHEHSHVEHRHHRYLLATEVAVAIVPPLRRLAGQVHFATERWADEDAALEVGGDRNLVARAIAHAALASVDHQRSAMALADTGVGARVRAMVEVDGRILAPTAGTAAGLVLTASTLAGATIQLHHLVVLLDHIR